MSNLTYPGKETYQNFSKECDEIWAYIVGKNVGKILLKTAAKFDTKILLKTATKFDDNGEKLHKIHVVFKEIFFSSSFRKSIHNKY